jgi:hypothetical protein
MFAIILETARLAGVIKNRSPDQTQISVSLPKDLLVKIEARAKSLNITRSAYFVHLVRNDLREPGSFTLHPEPAPIYPLRADEGLIAADEAPEYRIKKKKP